MIALPSKIRLSLKWFDSKGQKPNSIKNHKVEIFKFKMKKGNKNLNSQTGLRPHSFLLKPKRFVSCPLWGSTLTIAMTLNIRLRLKWFYSKGQKAHSVKTPQSRNIKIWKGKRTINPQSDWPQTIFFSTPT
jgi:hypothetical protein